MAAASVSELRASTPVVQDNQRLQALQEKVTAIKKMGPLALFFGRCPGEPLPKEKGITWVGLGKGSWGTDPGNHWKVNPETLERYGLNKHQIGVVEERLYLDVDFKNPAEIALIRGLFSRVILDKSTYKFLTDEGEGVAIVRLASLLDPQQEGMLVADLDSQLNIFPEKKMKAFVSQQKWLWDQQVKGQKRWRGDPSHCVSDDEFSKLRNSLIDERTSLSKLADMDVWERRRLRLEKKAFLERLFKDVSAVIYEPYPYPTRWCKGQSHYFIAKGLK
jgi:hypothetical protein